MTKKNVTIVAAVTVIVAMSFWAGYQFQKAQYKDACLDLGGGAQNSGQYPICVIERQNAALSLGPIRVTQDDVVEFQLQRGVNGQPLVRLALTPGISSLLTAFTTQSISQNMDIRIGGQLVNSVRISEAIQGTSLILALSEEQAAKLKELLSWDTD